MLFFHSLNKTLISYIDKDYLIIMSETEKTEKTKTETDEDGNTKTEKESETKTEE